MEERGTQRRRLRGEDWLNGEIEKERDGVAWFDSFYSSHRSLQWKKARGEDKKMERMESMEPISAHYTTDYPEIHPDSGYESRETTDSQAKTPSAATYDEELVHKVWRYCFNHDGWFQCQEFSTLRDWFP